MTRSPAPRKWRAPHRRKGAAAQEAAAAILGAALFQARSNARGALESGDPGFLHQLRVGLRRYRSALRVFRKLLRKAPRKRLARRARALMQPLGTVRDWDVLAAWLEQVRAPRAFARRVAQRRRAARGALRPIDLSKLEPGAAIWKGKAWSLESFALRVLPKLRRKVRQRAARTDLMDAAERHRLRIDVKRLRYATDFLAGEAPALKELQDTLGALNDLAVARRLLAGLQPPPTVVRRLAADERALIAVARRQIAAFEAED